MVNPWADYYAKADNLRSRPKRASFWERIIHETKPRVVLEVGCGDGLNLEHIIAPTVVGIDSYEPSLELARERLGNRVLLMRGDARNLKLGARSVDLAITCTMLQHITDDNDCRAAIFELIRVSHQWVVVMEYQAPERTPVPWRGNSEGIVKRDWGTMLQMAGLKIHDSGFLPHDEDGFDDVAWYLCKR